MAPRNKEQDTSEIRDSLRFVQKRFQFNIEQIEKRYSGNSSGLVFNLNDDTVEFDSEECDATNETELLNNVKKELHKHTIKEYGGAALLSTPAQDPDEKEKTNITGWQKLNKLYDTFLCKNTKREVKPHRAIELNRRQIKQETTTPTLREIKRELGIEDSKNRRSLALMPRLIKQEAASIAESHAIEEPIIPLMPKFRTPRHYPVSTPLTRSRKRMLAIEENYDKRIDTMYSSENWVDFWVNQSSKQFRN